MEKKEKKEKKPKKLRRPSRILFLLVSLVLLVVVAINGVVMYVHPYFGFVNNILTASTNAASDDAVAATAAGKDMTRLEEEEGIILLKNENNTLPLSGETKLNVFGYGSWNTTFGGTGSGAGDSSNNVTFIQGLEQAGFTVNQDLVSFYAENGKRGEDMGLVGTDWGIYENALSEYSEELLSGAQNFSDVALFVIARVGGEGFDLPTDMAEYPGGSAGKSYVELQNAELEVLDMLKQRFGTVVIVVNSTNTMELGFLDDAAVDAAIWIGCPGSTGCTAVGEVLSGAVNPSGRTTDTFAYAVESSPSYYDCGEYDYTNVTYANTAMFAGTGDAEGNEGPYHYVDYIEGIYVGYRYYETAAADGFIDYDATVQYPFGYGLSYTSFSQKITAFKDNGSEIAVDVTVTNTGSTAGKDVVELYYSAPYYKGGIEKSDVVLCGFDKTALLQPGESQIITLTFNYEDMASYDYTGIKAAGGAYVLEAGDYTISLRSDSHNVIDSRTVTVAKDVIYNEANDGARSSDGTEAVNLFDEVSFGGDLTYVSRADWAGTMPTERAPQSKAASAAVVEALTNVATTVENANTESYKTKNNHLKLSDMEGLSYDDEKWELLLDEISLKDMEWLIGNGGWYNMGIKSIGKPATIDIDGPNGLNNILAGTTGNSYTNQATLGATWNPQLAYEKGQVYGQEAEAFGISGIYGPAMNIHRNPFSGRNYEYYSEDGYLSGVMAAAEVKGINESNVFTYIKHYAVNDQEAHRCDGGLLVWANEQAMREIYLRGFEVAVKEGKTLGIMSSYNRLGTTPVAESPEMLTTILRNEWGFEGVVITDCVMACTTENINRALLAGNDLQLNLLANLALTSEITDTVSGHQVLRQATKNILFADVNSGTYHNDKISTGLYSWEWPLIAIDIVILALILLYYVRRHKKMKRWKAWKKEQQQ